MIVDWHWGFTLDLPRVSCRQSAIVSTPAKSAAEDVVYYLLFLKRIHNVNYLNASMFMKIICDPASPTEGI